MQIEIVPYDPGWAGAFEAERQRLKERFGDLAVRIDHHGSTAISGLAAKPVIDVQISVKALHPLEPYAARLAQLGYTHLVDPDDAFAPFFFRPLGWPHTHHVHVVESGGLEERKTLAFRDYLRAHHEAAREYQQLKRTLAVQYSTASGDVQQAYAVAKGAFIRRITDRALAEGYPHIDVAREAR